MQTLVGKGMHNKINWVPFASKTSTLAPLKIPPWGIMVEYIKMNGSDAHWEQ